VMIRREYRNRCRTIKWLEYTNGGSIREDWWSHNWRSSRSTWFKEYPSRRGTMSTKDRKDWRTESVHDLSSRH
jgi:hypothetical protein